jgi:hypothetical protein
MPNYVNNHLTIICTDDKTMDKIRAMIFTKDENNNTIYNMKKILPRPPEFAVSTDDIEYGEEWSWSIWGTKWDAHNCQINDSGRTITISYQTAWEPNEYWVELLCDSIQNILSHHIDPPYVSVKLKYTELMGDYGGVFDWMGFNYPIAKRYPLLLYAQLNDKPLYESILEYHELCKSVGIPIQPSTNNQPSTDNIDDSVKGDDYEDLPFET